MWDSEEPNEFRIGDSVTEKEHDRRNGRESTKGTTQRKALGPSIFLFLPVGAAANGISRLQLRFSSCRRRPQVGTSPAAGEARGAPPPPPPLLLLQEP